MRKNLLLIGFVFIFSCGIKKQSIEGEYIRKGKDYFYNLTLKSDSTFVLEKKYFEANAKCEGKWSYINKDSILLNCNEESFPAQISSGYMSFRKPKIKILGNKKIKIDNIILKKR